MAETNERLREKTLQIASLNQRMEALQAQLGGSHKRANQLGEQVTGLETIVSTKDSELQMLRSELAKTKGALDSVGKTVHDMKTEQTQLLSKKQQTFDDSTLRDEVALLNQRLSKMKDDIKLLSEAATEVLLGKEDSMENLREVIKVVGDPEYKILNLVLNRRRIKIEEIAAMLLENTQTVMALIDNLQNAGEIEIVDGSTVIPAKKYREVKIPVEEWNNMEPEEIFDSLIMIVDKAESKENIVEVLEKAVDILEQKIARGGTLIFQMRRTATSWSKAEGDRSELSFAIKDWKSRAAALS
ncbi:MAG: hypothetical protein ACTSUO_08855 [Candidatus Thorarchaeota archaeon]